MISAPGMQCAAETTLQLPPNGRGVRNSIVSYFDALPASATEDGDDASTVFLLVSPVSCIGPPRAAKKASW